MCICTQHVKMLTSPLLSICGGYIYIAILSGILYSKGFYENSTFFSCGIPVDFMGTTVDDYPTYFTLLGLFFAHQLINNWVNDVTYPWIINSVQDPKSDSTGYSRSTSLLIVNMFALYSQLDVLFIISGVMSQLTFILVLMLANMISATIINWQYLKKKCLYPIIRDRESYGAVRFTN